MRTRTVVALLGSALLTSAAVSSLAESPVWAQKKAAGKAADKAAPADAGNADAPSRAVGELAGKYKWGMSPQEVQDLIAADLSKKFQPKIQAETDPAAQDVVRRELNDAIAQMRASYIRFNGQKTGWDVSLVDREFGHRNNESMLILWEADQRRFLFFWKEKLYKQYIAYKSEKFKGMDFETFATAMQGRYGKAQMSFAKQQTGDEMALDYYEWPPSGDFVLRAYDQSGFYGNFCLSLMQKSTGPQAEKERAVNSPPRVRRTNVHVVDSVMQGDSATDPNADVVDDVVGKRALPSVEQKRVQERIQKEYQRNKELDKKQQQQ